MLTNEEFMALADLEIKILTNDEFIAMAVELTQQYAELSEDQMDLLQNKYSRSYEDDEQFSDDHLARIRGFLSVFPPSVAALIQTRLNIPALDLGSYQSN